MARAAKILERAQASPNNIRFDDVRYLAEAYGFVHRRTNGSHHIYFHPSVPDPLNLQEDNGKAKAYQVRQLLTYIEDYDLQPT